METPRITPTAPEAARLIEDLLRLVQGLLRSLAGTLGNRLIRTGAWLGRWAGRGTGTRLSRAGEP